MSLVSHDPSEIIQICWFGAQETFILSSTLTVVLLNVYLFKIQIEFKNNIWINIKVFTVILCINKFKMIIKKLHICFEFMLL